MSAAARVRLLACCGVLAAATGLGPAGAAPVQYRPVRLAVPARLPDATQGKAYSYSFAADVSGGTGPPYNWSLEGGSLPSGLRLNALGGALAGTVAAGARVGSYGFTVCATGRKRPVTGSAPGNRACDSTAVHVVKAAKPAPAPAPQPVAACTISAQPPGVNVQIDGPRQTTVIAETPNCFHGQVRFSTVGSPPSGVSISFLAAPAGTQGATLSVAAAQDASEGTYELTILASSAGQRAQTVVTVTVGEPDFSGTYTGAWSGTFTSSGSDGCTFSEGGTATIVVVKSLPGSYNVTETFTNTVATWSANPCAVKTTTTETPPSEAATYASGSVTGPTISITGGSASGSRSDTYPGGAEQLSFRAQKQ